MPDISTIITNIHQKPVVFKYRVLIVIYYSHLFLYIKFSLRVLNNLLLYIHIYIFLPEHSRFTGQQGKGESIYLTPLYYFHSLHRHLDISRAITAESSPVHIGNSRTRTREPLVSEGKSLTTKLRALNNDGILKTSNYKNGNIEKEDF